MNKIIKNFKNIKYGPAPEDATEVINWINKISSPNKNYINGQWNIVMPKLKSYDTDSFSFPIGNKSIIFANVKGQRTYIKNRMDRLMTKEPETIKWINTFDNDSVFFDVGANIGIYTLYSAMTRNNIVYAFEPHAASYKNLLDSINLNKLQNWDVRNCSYVDFQCTFEILYILSRVLLTFGPWR